MFYSKLVAVFYATIFSLFMEMTSCEVFVYNIETHNIEIVFKDAPSRFGDLIPPGGIRGMVVLANPEEACNAIEGPPKVKNFTGKWIVLIKRYKCFFDEKVRNAQKAGYNAAIVYNVNSSDLEPMAANDSSGIYIPSIFIGAESGIILKERYLYDDGYYITINDDLPFSITPRLLLIFSVLVGLCFFIIIIFIVMKYFKDRRRQRRHRLPKSSLNKLGIHKFVKNDPYEMCAICLEEYVEDDKLRVLPCSHAYHSKCIDPWLTKNRRVCPVCKRKIFASGEVVTDTDSDSDDETAPLVRNNSTPSNGGTFVRQVENPFRRAMAGQQRNQSESSQTSSDTTASGSVYSSVRSLPEMSRHSRQAGGDVRNLIQEPSINSAGASEVPVVRTGWQNFFQDT
ncbi:UNVERIFIED_CONTAM: hypothetical protein PYX00_002443 [Menopon gallinae]|uniref:RING-type E3 ubiquitin transferase n=1 Tax=Menopon gallinae TaxID=328185 RepID=A0AAW2IH42_9NEOP